MFCELQIKEMWHLVPDSKVKHGEGAIVFGRHHKELHDLQQRHILSETFKAVPRAESQQTTRNNNKQKP